MSQRTSGIRKRVAPQVEVPSLTQDPEERKRVLNVLAQRRYRQRKREHLKELEAKAGRNRTASSSEAQEKALELPIHTTEVMIATEEFPTLEDPVEKVSGHYSADQQSSAPFISFDHQELINDSQSTMMWSTTSDIALAGSQMFLDPQVLFPFSSLGSPTASFSMNPVTSSRSSTGSRSYGSTAGSMGGSPTSFSDEAYLPIHGVKLLRGMMTIAKALDIEKAVWSLDSVSPFLDPNLSPDRYLHLPINLHPTPTQMMYPHHPVLDLLPWPSVRDKLIWAFSAPEDIRPPCARGPTAFVDFMHDFEDSEEGVRFSGENPYVEGGWEVGRKIFKDWWWAFNSSIVQQSNQRRKQRGQLLLGQKSTM